MRQARVVSFALLLAAQPAAAQESGGGPEVFEPGVISVEGSSMFRGAFAPDGRAFYFFRKVSGGEEEYRIFVSHLRNFQWSAPERVDLGGEHSDLYPTISPDGRRMVFTSYRPAPRDTSARRNANLWYADRREDGWGAPVFMSAASSLSDYDSAPSFQPDGSVRFLSTTPDWRTTRHLVTRWTGDRYGTPEPDPLYAPWSSWRPDHYVWNVTPHPDGTLVILDVSRVDPATGQRGPTDLWASFRRGEGWTDPVPLRSGVNTEEAYENFAVFSPDGGEIFFVRAFGAYHRTPVLAAVGRPPS